MKFSIVSLGVNFEPTSFYINEFFDRKLPSPNVEKKMDNFRIDLLACSHSSRLNESYPGRRHGGKTNAWKIVAISTVEFIRKERNVSRASSTNGTRRPFVGYGSNSCLLNEFDAITRVCNSCSLR